MMCEAASQMKSLLEQKTICEKSVQKEVKQSEMAQKRLLRTAYEPFSR
jgi:hypothetical protein